MKHIDLIDNFIGIDKIGDHGSILARLKGKTQLDLLRFSAELECALPLPYATHTPYSYVANSSQSGLPFPCASLDCRASRSREILSYSAIYVDQLVLANPFTYIKQRYHPKSSARLLKDEVASGLALALSATPLIKRKIATFYPFEASNICSDCYSRAMKLYATRNKRTDLLFDAMDQIIKATKTVERADKNGHIHYRVTGPPELLDHSYITFGGDSFA